jgi:hypothetical protein
MMLKASVYLAKLFTYLKIKSVYQKYLPNRYVSFLQALIKFNKHHTLTTKVFMSLYRNFMTTYNK